MLGMSATLEDIRKGGIALRREGDIPPQAIITVKRTGRLLDRADGMPSVEQFIFVTLLFTHVQS